MQVDYVDVKCGNFSIRVSATGENRAEIGVLDSGGTWVGGPVRIWEQDGRFKGDLPGVDGGSFHVVNGHMDVGLGESC